MILPFALLAVISVALRSHNSAWNHVLQWLVVFIVIMSVVNTLLWYLSTHLLTSIFWIPIASTLLFNMLPLFVPASIAADGPIQLTDDAQQALARGHVCLRRQSDYAILSTSIALNLRHFCFVITSTQRWLADFTLHSTLDSINLFLRDRMATNAPPILHIALTIDHAPSYEHAIPFRQLRELLTHLKQVRGSIYISSSNHDSPLGTSFWHPHSFTPRLIDRTNLGRLVISWCPLFHPSLIHALVEFINTSLVEHLIIDTYTPDPLTFDQLSAPLAILLKGISSSALRHFEIGGGKLSLEGLSTFLKNNAELTILMIDPCTVIPSGAFLEDDCDILGLEILYGSLFMCHQLLMRYKTPLLIKLILQPDDYNNQRMDSAIIYDTVKRASEGSLALNDVSIQLPPSPNQAGFLLDLQPRHVQVCELFIRTAIGVDSNGSDKVRLPLDPVLLLRLGPWLESFGQFGHVKIEEGGHINRSVDFLTLTAHVGDRKLSLEAPCGTWDFMGGVVSFQECVILVADDDGGEDINI